MTTSANLAKITVADIQNKKTSLEFDRAMNKIRKAWVLQMPESEKAKMKVIPQQTRFELYAHIDDMVQKEWIAAMRKYYDDSIAKGAKTIRGKDILEKGYQIDTDELLIEAASVVVTRLIAIADGK
ncbi:RNA polymerase binding protein [Escherichia phage vB_Eco_SAP]|nr:BLAST-P NR database RNA polymerase binding protein A [Escherichia phage RB49] [Escherichia phage vB_Eco_TB34]